MQRANLLSEVEDIYRPYKQKRKTRASAAREKGLEPLAQFLQAQRQGSSLEQEAQKFVDPKKGWRMLHRRLPVRRTSWQSS